MAFTYDLTATGDDLVISQIRLEIGDTDNGTDAGVKPNGTNFSDAELTYFYDDEGSVLGGAARACEVLHRMWSRTDESVRIRDYQITAKQQAENYRNAARDLRERDGSRYKSGSAPATRVDGYSNDVNSQETEPSSEYWQERKTLKW